MRLDSYDLKILRILQSNGRITKSSLAEAINLSISPCWERVKRLEEAGIIRGYGAQLNTEILLKRASVMVEISPVTVRAGVTGGSYPAARPLANQAKGPRGLTEALQQGPKNTGSWAAPRSAGQPPRRP